METFFIIIGVIFGIALIWGIMKVGWDAEKTQRAAREHFDRENAKAREAAKD